MKTINYLHVILLVVSLGSFFLIEGLKKMLENEKIMKKCEEKTEKSEKQTAGTK